MEPGIRYQALEQDQAQVVLAFGTDGQVAGLDLVLLEDDKGLWPPYHVAPVVRNDTLTANPGIADALNPVAPLLTDQVMSALNWQVDGPDGLEPDGSRPRVPRGAGADRRVIAVGSGDRGDQGDGAIRCADAARRQADLPSRPPTRLPITPITR